MNDDTIPSVMTRGEFRALTEYLGFTVPALAEYLGVQERSVRRWYGMVKSDYGIPDEIVAKVVELLNATDTLVVELTVTYRHREVMSIYKRTETFWEEMPQYEPLPANWHRVVAYRVARALPGLTLDYVEADQNDEA